MAGALAQFYMAKAQQASTATKTPSTALPRLQRRATIAMTVRWPKPSRCVRSARYKQALEPLDKLSGAVEQTAEYLYQRAATVSALGGNPTEVIALYERAVDADGQACRRSVWPGTGKRSPRQRRDRASIFTSDPLRGFPRTSASLINLGISTKTDTSTNAPSSATSACWIPIPITRGHGCLPKTSRLAATCITTKTPSGGTTASARC